MHVCITFSGHVNMHIRKKYPNRLNVVLIFPLKYMMLNVSMFNRLQGEACYAIR
jgi:hypothetical protein